MTAAVRTLANAVCAGCACLCDDLTLTIQNERITQAERACALGRAWFRARDAAPRPVALLDGRAASLEAAIAAAAHILAQARSPLVCGLSAATSEAQQAAVALADRLGATLDSATVAEAAPAGPLFRATGESTATLGEVRNRADLVIVWGGDPALTHPRLFERYAVAPAGLFVPNGRAGRTVVVVNTHRTASAAEADLFIQIQPGSDFELLWALRALAQGKAVAASVAADTGVPLAALTGLVEQMKRCQFGALFYDAGLGSFTLGAVQALVTALNAFTHVVASPLRGRGNAAGAENVMAWQTGYPSAVSFSRGYPRHSPGEFSAASALARGAADAVLFLGDVAELSDEARARLRQTPSVIIGPNAAQHDLQAGVAITTATPGLDAGGTFYRLDDVPIALRPALTSVYPAADVVLRTLLAQLER